MEHLSILKLRMKNSSTKKQSNLS